MLARLVALVIGLLAVLISARLFGPAGRGVLASFAVLQFITATGLALGTGSGAFLASHRGSLIPAEAARGLLLISVALGLGASMLAAAAWLVGWWQVAAPGTSLAVAMALGPAVAGQYLVLGASQIAIGVGETRRTGVGWVLGPAVVVVAVLSAALLGLSVADLLLLQALLWLLAGAGLVLSWLGGGGRSTLSAAGSLLRLGRGAALGDLTNALSYRLDVLLVIALAGSTTAGVYSLSTQMLEPLWLLASSMAGGLLIGFRGKDLRIRGDETATAVRRVTWTTAAGAALVIVLLPVAATVAGPGFGDVPVVGAILSVGIVALAMAKVLAAYQTSLGRLWIGSAVSSCAVLVAVLANLVLIPRFGAAGAALAASISYGLACVLWLYAFRSTRRRVDRPAAPTALATREG